MNLKNLTHLGVSACAKEQDLLFDEDVDDEDDPVLEARSHEAVPPVKNNADTTRKLCEDELVDFDDEEQEDREGPWQPTQEG